MKVMTCLLNLVIFCVSLTGCKQNREISGAVCQPAPIRVPDVTKSNTYTLLATPCDTHFNVCRITVTGRIDGVASIKVMTMNLGTVSGVVATNFGFDWFDTYCPVRYEPEGVTTGTLELNAFFGIPRMSGR